MCMYPNFETIFIPKHKPETLLRLTDSSDTKAYNAAVRSQGNIRNFFTYLDDYDEMDMFQTPKEFITDILCDPKPIEIYDSISEHGHMWDIFQENYLNSVGVNTVAISHSFSNADYFDSHIYSSGNWNLMPYFVLPPLKEKRLDRGVVRLNMETIRCENRKSMKFIKNHQMDWELKNCVY